MPASAQPTSTRIPSIDLLRGLCILAVVLLHVDLRIKFKENFLGAHLPDPVLRGLFRSGYYGVIVFFVISGFLITSVSLKRWGSLRKINPVEFYKIRFARIGPCLIGLLILLTVLELLSVPGFVITPGRASLPRAIFSAVTFHLNWLEAKFGYLPGAWDVLWSLSVEEAFYFGFPLICRWIRNSTALISIMAAFVIIGPFARTTFTQNPIWADHSYFSCMDGIALGFFAALLKNRVEFSRKVQPALRITGSVVALFVIFAKSQVAALGLYRAGLDVTMLELAAVCMILGIGHNTYANTSNIAAPLRWLGRNSYEVYLTHMFVVTVAVQLFRAIHAPINSSPLWYAAILCLSGLLGHLVAQYYSEPLNRKIRAQLIPRGTLVQSQPPALSEAAGAR